MRPYPVKNTKTDSATIPVTIKETRWVLNI